MPPQTPPALPGAQCPTSQWACRRAALPLAALGRTLAPRRAASCSCTTSLCAVSTAISHVHHEQHCTLLCGHAHGAAGYCAAKRVRRTLVASRCLLGRPATGRRPRQARPSRGSEGRALPRSLRSAPPAAPHAQLAELVTQHASWTRPGSITYELSSTCVHRVCCHVASRGVR